MIKTPIADAFRAWEKSATREAKEHFCSCVNSLASAVQKVETTNEIPTESERFCEAMLDVLDKMDKEPRLEFIDDMIHRLGFERRMTLLTEKQRVNMDEQLTPEMRKRLDNAKNEEERENLITGWARTMYFRRCAWIKYLNEGGEPPIAGDPPVDHKGE